MKQHFIIVFLVYVTSLVQSLNNSNKCGVRSYGAPLNNASQSLGIFSNNSYVPDGMSTYMLESFTK